MIKLLKPKYDVDVIMPVYNGMGTIGRALDSLVDQDFKGSFRVIVVDNSSDDRTVDIVSAFAEASSLEVLLLHEKNRGAASARNRGIEASDSKYIAFLDADDQYTKSSLSRRVEVFEKFDVSVVYGSYIESTASGRSLIVPPLNTSIDQLLRRNVIGNLTGMYSVERMGKYFQSDVGHEDYDMWLRMAADGAVFKSSGSRPLGVYQASKSSLSGNKFRSMKWHYDILRSHVRSPLKRFYLMTFYLSYHLKKVACNWWSRIT